MGRIVTYTDAELAQLLALHDELEGWGEARLMARWNTRKVSAFNVHEFALERGLRVAALDKPWSYTLVLRALQRAGRMPERASEPGGRRPPESRKPTSSGTMVSPARSPKQGPDAVHAFFARDLGEFLRPEDRARSKRALDAAAARKIQELTTSLAEKTEMRAELEMYLGVYDRVISRLVHRLDVLREKGVDPETEEAGELAGYAAEDAEALAAHHEISAVAKIDHRTSQGARKR